MESRKKMEAIRAREIAIEKMQNKDFTSAQRSAMKAQQLCNDLDDINQIIMICSVHSSVGFQEEKDWYKILRVDPTADEVSIRRQYNKMALTLHPDRNKFPGAPEAFHLVLQAKAVLTNSEKRRLYDSICKGKAMADRSMDSSIIQKSKKPRSMRSRSRRKNDVAAQKLNSCSISKPEEDVKRVKVCEFEMNSKILEYSDGEFNDFEKERGKKWFSRDQVWAVYDTLDAMPRFYALINDVIAQDFKVQITWLEPLPNNDNEKKWLYQGLPVSFGKFKLGYSETIEDHEIFSHLVFWKKSGHLSDTYEIYPRKGETWALFKNWDFDWFKDVERHKVNEFEVVEIVSDYFGEFGVNVRYLSKKKGSYSGFGRRRGEGVDWEVIQGKNRLRFSHKIPSFAVTMIQGCNDVANFFELDPAALPSNFSQYM